MHGFSWDPERDSVTFWREWALGQFGPSAAPGAAAVFVSIDSFDTPRPVNWRSGPGTLAADASQCPAVAAQYAFVDAFAQLRAAKRQHIVEVHVRGWLARISRVPMLMFMRMRMLLC